MSLAVRIIPTMLKRGSALVKGERYDSWRAVGHVLQAAKIYAARGVDELCLIDIAATPEGRRPDFDAVKSLTAECFAPLTVGGGVRTLEDVRGLLAAGADKVLIGTIALEAPETLHTLSARFGRQAIVAALDVQSGSVWIRPGHVPAESSPVAMAKMLEREGAGEILLTSVDREGTLQGYDLDLVQEVAGAVGIPVVAHGGCAGYSDMLSVIRAGASGVAAGALFQFTDATPRGAARWLGQNGVEVRT